MGGSVLISSRALDGTPLPLRGESYSLGYSVARGSVA